MIGVEMPVGHAIVEQNPRPLHHHPRPECALLALQLAHGIPPPVDDDEAGGVPAFFGAVGLLWGTRWGRAVLVEIGVAGGRIWVDPLPVDEGGALPSVHLGEHAFHGDVEEVGVGDVGLAVGEGQLFRLDHHVNGLRGVAPEPLNIELLDDVQLLEQYVAAGVWRRLEDGVAAIVGGDGVLPLTVEATQVFKGE